MCIRLIYIKNGIITISLIYKKYNGIITIILRDFIIFIIEVEIVGELIEHCFGFAALDSQLWIRTKLKLSSDAERRSGQYR